MASTALPPAGLALHGAPDATMGSHDPAAAVQVMHLEMTEDVVDELLKSIRSGKAPQLLFGKHPILKYGDTKRVLDTQSEKTRSELYRTDGDSKGGMAFAGLVSHRLGVRKAHEVTAGADEALATLKNTMASMKKEKEAHMSSIDDDAEYLAVEQQAQKYKKYAKGKSKLGGAMTSSYPSSPALGSTAASPVPGRAPTSAPTSHLPALQQALRKPLVHLLAIKPARPTDLVHKLRAPKDDVFAVLRKIARPMGTDDSGEWKLMDKSYKELDVWKFPYPASGDRQAAIDNAVKAFDRQRLDAEEKEWQSLLPVEERGKGKTLSRLHLGAADGHEKVPTPLMKPKVNLKKVLAAPKKEAKKRAEKADKVEDKEAKAAARKAAREAKAAAALEGKESKAPPVRRVQKAADGEVKAKANAKTAEKQGAVKLPEREAKPVPTTEASDRERAPAVKRPAATNGAGSARVAKPKSTQPKITQRPSSFTSTKRVQEGNSKPKNPSPLSASPPVNASDLEDSHPAHKALSASTSSSSKSTPLNSDKHLKRRANDIDDDIHKHDVGVSVKRSKAAHPAPAVQKAGTGTGTANAAGTGTGTGTPSLKRKADAQHDAATPKRAAPAVRAPKASASTNTPGKPSTASNGNGNGNGNATTGNGTRAGTPTSSRSPSPEPLSLRQTVDLSKKFKAYYAQYEVFHQRLCKQPAITAEEREKLMGMHVKLVEMKREIYGGARGVERRG